MWLPRRFTTKPTSVRDWHVLVTELGERAVLAIRTENHYGRFPR